MKRRGFLSNILKAGLAAVVLPSALTYKRTWKKTETLWVSVINPEWVKAEYDTHIMFDLRDYVGDWNFIKVAYREQPDGTFAII